MTTTTLDPTIAAAVEALTAAARRTYQHHHDGGTRRYDFAETAAQVLTMVAANLGGVDELLSVRDGSWEADLVRRLIENTATDERILSWRTEPYRLYLDVAGVFMDFGISDMFDAERDAAAEATYADGLDDAQAAAAEARVTAIEALYDQDRDAYAAAYLDVARAWLEERGLTAGVELVRTDFDRPGYRSGPDPLKVDWTGLDDQLSQHVREHTKLPQTDAPPNGVDPAAAIRAAGRTYGERVDQAAAGEASS